MTHMASWEGEPIEAWRSLWNVPILEVHECVTSTNDRVAELSREGAPALTTVLALEQSRGRGRSGKKWHSAAGTGLWISTLFVQKVAVSSALPLLVGLAAARALESLTPELRVGLKWPNDLFLEGGKVGGILCESTVGEAELRSVVVGVGLNLREAEGGFPPELGSPATTLEHEIGQPVSTSLVATRLMAQLRGHSRGAFDSFTVETRSAFAERDLLYRKAVRTEQGAGTAHGIDGSGALILERSDGTRTSVRAGSVELI
jgi:BirA family biotin operon repressor/biotin-[acetyl-CoA-carboxylase] ligase